MTNPGLNDTLPDAEVDALLDAAPVNMAYLDEEGRFRYATEAYARLHGTEPSGIAGRPLSDVANGSFETIRPVLERALAGEAGSAEVRHHRPEPRWHRHRYTPDVGPDGALRGCFVVVEDIHAHKELEGELAQFKYACDQGMEGFSLHDIEGLFTYLNDREAEIYGYSREEVLGKSWKLLYGPEEIERIENVYFPELMREGKWRGELKGRRKSGELFDVEVSLTLLVDDEGEPTGLSCNCRDITERNLAEASLRQLHRIEALGQLTGGVAHDFNNLLAVIVGNLDLVRMQVDSDPESEEFSLNALRAAQHAAELTNRLLAFARKQTLQPRVVDVREMVDGMSKLMGRTLGERIEVAIEHVGEPWLCEVDASQLENAVLNLAINSRDAMPDGGRIVIRTENRSGDPDAVEISVRDTGAGMPAEVCDKMFDPFFTTKEIGAGSGLGLSMVHGFVSQSGGEVEVESEEGHGTTVRIRLPRVDSSPQASPRSASQAWRANGELVLLIDDNDAVLRVVTRQLERLGLRVLGVGGAPEALELAREHDDIALVLSDVVLPGDASGPELVERIRSEVPAAAGLLMSGYCRDEISEQQFRVLPKPFTAELLAGAVRDAIA